jgi:hypothetical protein
LSVAGGLLERFGLVAMARVLLGWPPVLIVLTTRLVAGLIRETEPSKLFDAQTEPKAYATSQTLTPTRIRLTTLTERRLTRSTVDVP